jgi:hypothetical protein
MDWQMARVSWRTKKWDLFLSDPVFVEALNAEYKKNFTRARHGAEPL